jgi:capsular polysaccharide biosynthesis protein
VLGDDGAVVAPDRRLLWDLSYHWPGRPHRHPVYAIDRPSARWLPGSTVTLAAMGAATNYFHFLCNSLARLAYLPEPDGRSFAVDRFLVSGAVTPLVAEALGLLGIPRERITGTADLPASRPERLIVPPLVSPTFVIPPHVCDFLHERFVTTSGARDGAGRRRLFIDRSDAPRRRIRNLPALRSLLDEMGFEVVRLSGLGLAEQVRLFHDAELVVANHGAALANLVFCRPGTRVLQVLAPGMTEREYRTISQHRRLDHDYLCGDFFSSDDAALPCKDRDLVLDPARLRSVLTREFSVRPPRLRA